MALMEIDVIDIAFLVLGILVGIVLGASLIIRGIVNFFNNNG